MQYLIDNTDWNVAGPVAVGQDGSVSYLYTFVEGWEFGSYARRPLPIHNQMTNIGYADGHAKAMRTDQLIGPMPLGHPIGDPRNVWDNHG
jgi:prepilin-type processing-associated H-X9-DG protein